MAAIPRCTALQLMIIRKLAAPSEKQLPFIATDKLKSLQQCFAQTPALLEFLLSHGSYLTSDKVESLSRSLIEASNSSLWECEIRCSTECDICSDGRQLSHYKTLVEQANALTDFEVQVMDMLVSYLQNLLSMRNNLAAAKCFALVGTKALAALRKTALQVKLPLAQTCISFVERNKMNGTWKNDILLDHLPALTAYKDIIHNMQVELESAENTSLNKLLKVLTKSLLSTCDATPGLTGAVGKCTKILARCSDIMNSDLQHFNELFAASPKKSNSQGGTVVGRELFPLLQRLVDWWTTTEASNRVHFSEECLSPGRTFGFNSLSTNIRSPFDRLENIQRKEDVEKLSAVTPQRPTKTVRLASFLNVETPPTPKSLQENYEQQKNRVDQIGISSKNVAEKNEKENIPPLSQSHNSAITPKLVKKRKNPKNTKIAIKPKCVKSHVPSKNQPKISQFFCR